MASFNISYTYGRGRLKLFGQFALADPAGEPANITARKCKALVSYLAMHAGQNFDREFLAHLLWGEKDDALARQSLRQCKLMLARVLDPVLPNLFDETKDSLGICEGRLEVDALELPNLLHQTDDLKFSLLKQLYTGRFLRDLKIGSDEFSAWAHGQSETTDSIAADLLGQAVKFYLSKSDSRSALEAATRRVMIDPYREEWQRDYIRLYADCWGRASALAKAKGFLASLKRELDVEADEATLSLIDSIKTSMTAT